MKYEKVEEEMEAVEMSVSSTSSLTIPDAELVEAVEAVEMSVSSTSSLTILWMLSLSKHPE